VGRSCGDGALMAWQYGDVVVTRDVIDGKPWLAVPQYVVEDTAELLVTYLPEGAPIGYLPDSDHPWYPQPAWLGNGRLELRRPRDTYSVLHFWRGPEGKFSAWYLNLEEPYRRTPIGFDYADELDEHVAKGRYTAEKVARIRADGLRIGAELDAGARWWSDDWITWTPDPEWTTPELRDGWSDVPV
jgi:Protein of unknown function (DUF402)